MVRVRSVVKATSLVLMVCVGTPVSAQDQDQAKRVNQKQDMFEEVIVSARKRDESLQDIPLAITAFSAAKIDAMGARDLEDISEFTPGLYFVETGGGFNTGGRGPTVIRFRGMNSDSSGITQPLGALFVDGVYVAGGAQGLGLDNLERIEVIKGPQSAYFGRSTFGGAVNYVTRAPSEEFEGRVSAELANFGTTDISATMSGPLMGDKLAAQLHARYYETDGQYKNASSSGGRLGEQETKSISLGLFANPVDSFSATARVMYYEDEDGAPASVQYGTVRHNCNLGSGTFFCGVLPRPTAQEISLDTTITPNHQYFLLDNAKNLSSINRKSSLSHFGLKRDVLRLSLSMDWDIRDSLTLSSITAKNKENFEYLSDLDGRAMEFFPDVAWNNWASQSETKLEDFTQELRLASDSGSKLNWMVGVNYITQKVHGTTRHYAPALFFKPPYAPDGHYGQYDDNLLRIDEVATTGVFGALSYMINDQLTLDLEGRYQWDEVKSTAWMQETLQKTWDGFTPRVILSYQANEDWMVYGTYSVGKRPGRFNAQLVGQTQEVVNEIIRQTGAGLYVDEEELYNYEVGTKGTFMDGRALMALSVYFMDWKNQHTGTQAIIGTGTDVNFYSTTSAIGQTHLKGVELEMGWIATDELRFDATYNIADSEYKKYVCDFCKSITGSSDVTGNRAARFPRESGTFSGTFNKPVSSDIDMFVRADYIYRGSSYLEAINAAKTGSMTRVNLRSGLRSEGWSAEAYVENLLDDKALVTAARITDLFTLDRSGVALTLPERRTYGVRLKYFF